MDKVTEEIRRKLDKLRFDQQDMRRLRIRSWMPLIVKATNGHPYVRDVRFNINQGYVGFKYHGRRVRYWIGIQKLLVRNPVTYTVYKEFKGEQMLAAIRSLDPHAVFKVEEKDAELCDPRT